MGRVHEWVGKREGGQRGGAHREGRDGRASKEEGGRGTRHRLQRPEERARQAGTVQAQASRGGWAGRTSHWVLAVQMKNWEPLVLAPGVGVGGAVGEVAGREMQGSRPGLTPAPHPAACSPPAGTHSRPAPCSRTPKSPSAEAVAAPTHPHTLNHPPAHPPALAIERMPGPLWRSLKFSSANFSPARCAAPGGGKGGGGG